MSAGWDWKMSNEYELHKEIAKIIKDNIRDYSIRLDPACGGRHRLPLFYDIDKSTENRFCYPDILILDGSKIRVIIEIEASALSPTQICGKFLTSALSQCYIYKEVEQAEIDGAALFIQILDDSKLPEGTAKKRQVRVIEKAINEMINNGCFRIKRYKAFWASDLEDLVPAIRVIIPESR